MAATAGSRGPRIVVLTSGHPSTSPRMLKAANTLHAAGYDVRLVSADFAPWATATDRAVFASRGWRSTVVEYARNRAPLGAATTSLRWRIASAVARRDPVAAPWWAVTRAYSRAHDELVRAALAESADLYYGGTTGGLAPTAEAAQRCGRPYALDLEDWHTGESAMPDAHVQHGLAARIEAQVLPQASFVTAGSGAMADAYQSRYGRRVTPIHNVFPLPAQAPVFESAHQRLKICWFGQTLGPHRGLEEAVDIVARSGVPCDFDLRGFDPQAFGGVLRARAAAADVRLTVLPPVAPGELVTWCRDYQVGISAEPQMVENRRLCLSNKLCTYLLAGLAVIATDTPGQREVAADAGDGIAWYATGEIESAARALQRWAASPAALLRSRQDGWTAAMTRWHWEHPQERGALLDLVARAVAAEAPDDARRLGRPA